MGNSWVYRSPLTENDVARLFREGDPQDVCALLRNPSAKALFGPLFKREKPFEFVTDDQMIGVVSIFSGDLYLHGDGRRHPYFDWDFDRDSRDFDAVSTQEGVWHLLKTLPVTEETMDNLSYVISNIYPGDVYRPKEDPLPVIQRWQSAVIGEKTNVAGWETKDYFCVLLSALYGRWERKLDSGDVESINVGSADSPDKFLRCAFYGGGFYDSIMARADIFAGKKGDEWGEWDKWRENKRKASLLSSVRAAYERDGRRFLYAVMCDLSFVWDRNTRVLLEYALVGEWQHRRYWQICEQINQRTGGSFDVNPVSEEGRRKMQMLGVIPSLAEDQSQTQHLETRLSSIRKDMVVLSWWTRCVFGLLVVLTAVLWWRT